MQILALPIGKIFQREEGGSLCKHVIKTSYV